MNLSSISMPNAQTSPSGGLFQAALISASEQAVPGKQTGSQAKDPGAMGAGVRDFGAKGSNAGTNARSSAEQNEGALTASSEPLADISAIAQQTSTGRNIESAVDRPLSEGSPASPALAKEKHSQVAGNAASVGTSWPVTTVNSAMPIQALVRYTQTVPHAVLPNAREGTASPSSQPALNETTAAEPNPALNVVIALPQVQFEPSMSTSSSIAKTGLRLPNRASDSDIANEGNSGLTSSVGQNAMRGSGSMQPVWQPASTVATAATTPDSAAAVPSQLNAPSSKFQSVLASASNAGATVNAAIPSAPSSQGSNADLIAMMSEDEPQSAVSSGLSEVVLMAGEYTLSGPQQRASLDSTALNATSSETVTSTASPVANTSSTLPSAPAGWSYTSTWIARTAPQQGTVESGMPASPGSMSGLLSDVDGSKPVPSQKLASSSIAQSGTLGGNTFTSPASTQSQNGLAPQEKDQSHEDGSAPLVVDAVDAGASTPAQGKAPQQVASVLAGAPMMLVDPAGSLARNPILNTDAPEASTGPDSFGSSIAQLSGGILQTSVDLNAAVALPIAGISNAAGNQVVTKAAQKESSSKTDAKSSDLDGASNADASKTGTTTSSAHEAAARTSQNGGQAAQDSQGSSSQAAVAVAKVPDGTAQPSVGVAHTASHDTALPHGAPEVADKATHQSEERDLPGSIHPDGTEAAASSGIDAAKLIQRMGETEMRVGMRSSEFGEISIRTSVSQQQMLMQISLDHSDLSQAISSHVSATQAKLGDDHGLHALIEVNNQGSSFSGGSGESGSREQKAFTSSSRSQSTAVLPEVEKAANVGAMTGVASEHRLDIRA
jgi:hypothetical protein